MQSTTYSTSNYTSQQPSTASVSLRPFARGVGVALLLLSLSACSIHVNSPLPAQTASPSASPSSPGQSFRYALPLRINAQSECGGAEYLRYEVQANGQMRYLARSLAFEAEPQAQDYQELQLSTAQLQALQELLAEIDLAQHHADATPVPDDAPQTLECRTLAIAELDVNGETQSYTQNGRKFNYSAAYREDFERLLSKLESFAAQSSPAQYRYQLPLKISLQTECGGPDYLRYEVNEAGMFRYLREELPAFAPGKASYESRKLSRTEQEALLTYLNERDLLERMQASERVPADAPQTDDCRTVTVYEFHHAEGQASIEGEQTRQYQHDAALLEDLGALNKRLEELRES